MGTYEQPGQVLDNSIGELSKGFAAMTAGLGAGLMQRNAAKLKAAKANAAANQKNAKWYKDIEELRADFRNKDYPSGGIVDEKYQAFVEENLAYLYKMGKPKSEGGLGADSKEYRTLYNRTKELAQNSAAAVGLLNKSNEQFLGGYQKPNGGQTAGLKAFDQDGAFLNDPSTINTLQFQYDWAQNEGAHSNFFVKHGADGQILDYGINYEHMVTSDAGDQSLTTEPLSFRSYVDKTPGGFGKFNTLNRKTSLDKASQMWNTLGASIEKRYKPTVDKEETKTDGKKILEKTLNADLYTEKLEEAYLNEEDFDKNWPGGITQNDWQTYGFDSNYTGTAEEKEAFRRAVLDQAYKDHGYVNKLTREEQDLAASALNTRVSAMKSGQDTIPGLPVSVGGGTEVFEGMGLTTKAGTPFENAQEFVYDDYVKLANEISSVQYRQDLADILSQMAAGNGKTYTYKTSGDLVQAFKDRYKNEFPASGTTYQDGAGNDHVMGHTDMDKMEYLKNVVYWDPERNQSYYDPTQFIPDSSRGETDKLWKQTGSDISSAREVKIDASQNSLNKQAVLNLMLKETDLTPLEKRALQQSGTSAPSGSASGTQRKKTTTTLGELPTAITDDVQKMIDEGASNEELFEAITGPVDDLTELEETAATTPVNQNVGTNAQATSNYRTPIPVSGSSNNPIYTAVQDNDLLNKVADRIISWEETSGNGVAATAHPNFGFNSPGKVKDKKAAIQKLVNEYGNQFVEGLPEEILFQTVDWNFNADRSPIDLLVYATGFAGEGADGRSKTNKSKNLNDLFEANKDEIMKQVSKPGFKDKLINAKMELYMAPAMLKERGKGGLYSKEELKKGLQKQWGPRMGLSEKEINKWIKKNFDTLYDESLNA